MMDEFRLPNLDTHIQVYHSIHSPTLPNIKLGLKVIRRQAVVALLRFTE